MPYERNIIKMSIAEAAQMHMNKYTNEQLPSLDPQLA